MAKTRFISINHNYFELQKDTIKQEEINRWFAHSYDDIYSAYQSPSFPKRNIWEAWFGFFSDFHKARIAISSKNTWSFTIVAETEHFFFHITAWHKRVWLKDNVGMAYKVDEDGIIIPYAYIPKD